MEIKFKKINIKTYLYKNQDFIVYFIGVFFLLWILTNNASKMFTKNQKNVTKNTTELAIIASINLKPSTRNVEVGQEIELEIFVEPSLNMSNAVLKADINYTKDLISILSINPEPFCKNMIIKKTNSLIFSCKLDTQNNKNTRIKVAKARLKAGKSGIASLWINANNTALFGSKKINLNPIYSLGNTEKIIILDKDKRLKLPTVIYSTTHPLKDITYKKNNLKIEWLPLNNNLYYCLEISDKCQNPTKITDNFLNIKITEGKWYFTLLENEEIIAKRIFNIK